MQQHPALEWLQDKILFAFGRHDAPVVTVPGLARGEVIVLGTGILPNRKGHPLIQRWVGVRFEAGARRECLDLPAVMARTRFGRDEIPNPAAAADLSVYQPLIAPAVDSISAELHAAREKFTADVRPELENQLNRLAAFRDARTLQLELSFDKQSQDKERERRRIGTLYEQYQRWIRDTLETEDYPSIRIVAMFVGSK